MGGATAGGFLASLTPGDRLALSGAGTERRYRRDQWLFHQGDRSDFLVLLVEGRVKVVAGAAGGGEAILSVRGAGELVGELAAIDGSPRLAGARALEPLVVRVTLTQEELAAMVGTSRESVARALATLRADGLVTTKRRRISIRDRAALDHFTA